MTTNTEGESRIHFRRDSNIIIESLTAVAAQKITIGRDVNMTVSEDMSLRVVENSDPEIVELVKFNKGADVQTKNLTLFSVNTVKFNKDTTVQTEQTQIFADNCSNKQENTDVSEQCSAPQEPVLNQKPVAKQSCVSPSKELISCSATESYDPDGQIVKYRWFYNGNTVESINPFYMLYQAPVGIYQVEFEVEDDQGLISDRVMTSIEVIPNIAPVADFNCTYVTKYNL